MAQHVQDREQRLSQISVEMFQQRAEIEKLRAAVRAAEAATHRNSAGTRHLKKETIASSGGNHLRA